MEAIKNSANVANNSNNVANVANLNEVTVTDNTTTKGKVTGKFNINDQTAAEATASKIDKNALFSGELSDYFCPVKFDASALEMSLTPLVASGIMSEDTKAKTIDAAKREFMAKHEDAINAAQNMSFAEVLNKLQENETLYKKVLAACNVQSLNEENYINGNGKVMIYRAAQCKDKDGNNRYLDATLKRTENGKEFTQPLFVELREQTTANILLAIRYYSSKQNASKSLLNKVSDYRRILSDVAAMATKAKANGFSLEQVMNEVSKVFAN